jgi:hypothetical protein
MQDPFTPELGHPPFALLPNPAPSNETRRMTWTESFTCNICGKAKGSVDHWWVAWVETVSPSDVEEPKPKFQLLPWSELMARHPEVSHLCGAGCALKEAERWMSAATTQHRPAERSTSKHLAEKSA